MIIQKINSLVIYFLIFLIKIYQYCISPILKNNCKYLPTCSEYAIISLKEHGLIKGTYYSFKRLLSCHPFSKSGYDPVPKKYKGKI